MNKVILIGRLTTTPETKYINNDTCVVSGSIAVQREFKNKDGNYEADFISYTAFKATAELIGKFLTKGNKVCFEGRWQHRSYYSQNGDTRYVDELVVERVEFIEKMDSSGNNGSKTKTIDESNFSEQDNPTDDLPF